MEPNKSIEKVVFGMNVPTLVAILGLAATFTWHASNINNELTSLKKAPQQVNELEKKVISQEFEMREIKNTIKDMDKRSQESLEINKKVQEEVRIVSERMLKLTLEQEQQRRSNNRDDDYYNRNERRNR
jgi:hypothetical protein